MMLERHFQAAVLEYAEYLGWRVAHHARSDRNLRAHSSVGFPDLILVRGGWMIAAELKVGKRLTTDAQRAWLSEMDAVDGCTAVLWRPSAAPRGEPWGRVETSQGADFGAIGRRLRGGGA